MSDLVERLRNNSWNGRISAPFEEAADEIERLRAEKANLLKLVHSFELADTELRRAELTAEQPRLQKAGNRYVAARIKLFSAALAALKGGEDE